MACLFHTAVSFFWDWVSPFNMRETEVSRGHPGGILCFVLATGDTAVDCATGGD